MLILYDTMAWQGRGKSQTNPDGKVSEISFSWLREMKIGSKKIISVAINFVKKINSENCDGAEVGVMVSVTMRSWVQVLPSTYWSVSCSVN